MQILFGWHGSLDEPVVPGGHPGLLSCLGRMQVQRLLLRHMRWHAVSEYMTLGQVVCLQELKHSSHLFLLKAAVKKLDDALQETFLQCRSSQIDPPRHGSRDSAN
eukprot:6462940-Amphidinium_carterae.3